MTRAPADASSRHSYVSYRQDRDWLAYCLKSVQKFCEGFGGVTVLVPEVERADFLMVTDAPGVRLWTYQRHLNPRLWHLDHQRMKSRVDEICPDADAVLHIDSDCVFTERVTPNDYLRDGRPGEPARMPRLDG